MNYLLDTSALATHALQEAGGEVVQSLFDAVEYELSISSLSLFELAGVLKRNGSSDRISAAWATYPTITRSIPVDADLAQAAWRLREELGQRLPIADAIVAAAARSIGATLVHRDRHLAAIPDSVIPQIRLPGV